MGGAAPRRNLTSSGKTMAVALMPGRWWFESGTESGHEIERGLLDAEEEEEAEAEGPRWRRGKRL